LHRIVLLQLFWTTSFEPQWQHVRLESFAETVRNAVPALWHSMRTHPCWTEWFQRDDPWASFTHDRFSAANAAAP
jgi:hypothetical protein